MAAPCDAPPARRATPADAEELTRLRGVMIEAWGGDAASGDWRTGCAQLFAARLAPGVEDFVAYVVDDPGGGLLAGGVAWVEQHLPGPNNPTGRRGHIASMSTDPEHRRHGHARDIFTRLISWTTELSLTRIDLRATPYGEPLYRAFGFREPGGLALSWRLPGTDIMDLARGLASGNRDAEAAPGEAHG